MSGSEEERELFTNLLSLEKIPINATFILTNRCNFRCEHCYRSTEPVCTGELDFEGWRDIVDTLYSKGCIRLRLTGGEPLLHPDFCRIYEYAYDLGFYMELGTNGSLLTGEHLELLSRKPPESVAVSLYGASEETYRRFCRVGGMFTKVIEGVAGLKSAGVNVGLQTVLNRKNFGDLSAMKCMSCDMGVPFQCYRQIRCDTAGGDRRMLTVDEDQFMESLDIMGDRRELLDRIKGSDGMWRDGYKRCNAGSCSCSIDPYGYMFLCNQDTSRRMSVPEFGFDACWDAMHMFRKQDIEVRIECADCECRGLCGLCAPSYAMESETPGFREHCSEFRRIYGRLMRDEDE